MSFEEWLKNYKKSDGTCLSKTSVDHYIGGIKTVSKDMLSNGVIIKELDAMSVDELNLAADTIIKNSQFIEKNKTGNNMYSGALKYYLEYRKNNCSDDELTEEQLAIKLQEMIKQYGKVTGIHLFGIKYATIIQNNNYSIRHIINLANVQESFCVEISKGINLAKYVTMNDNISSTTGYFSDVEDLAVTNQVDATFSLGLEKDYDKKYSENLVYGWGIVKIHPNNVDDLFLL